MTPPPHEPSRRDRLRPAEYLIGAGIAALFTGVIFFFATRDLAFAAIWTGATFIVVLVVMALLMMTVKPDAAERSELDGDDGAGPRMH